MWQGKPHWEQGQEGGNTCVNVLTMSEECDSYEFTGRPHDDCGNAIAR